MSERDEEATAACVFLLHTIRTGLSIQRRTDAEEGALRFALLDLETRLAQLPAPIRAQYRKQAEDIFALKDDSPLQILLRWAKEENGSNDNKKLRADAVILTVIPVEFTATKKAFGVPDDARPAFQLGDREVFSASIAASDRRYGQDELKVYIMCVGRPKNVSCANACRDILAVVEPDAMYLVGIAGGNRQRKVVRGDVVASLMVYYCEGGKNTLVPRFLGRLEGRAGKSIDKSIEAVGMIVGYKRHFEPELDPVEAEGYVAEKLRVFRPPATELQSEFDQTIGRYERDDFLGGQNLLRREFSCHEGNVLCGEKVIVDRGLIEFSDRVSRKTYAVDMESYGFAATCRHLKKEWAIFRGISDYADPKKDDGLHVSASAAAASTARVFLRLGYRMPAERSKKLHF